MRELGDMLGQGATAEVFAYGDDYVVKLAKPSTHPSVMDYEVWVTRTVQAIGASAPVIEEVVEIDGRKGFVMERVEGRPLLELLLDGSMAADECGRILANVSHAVHSLPGGTTELRTFHDFAYPMLDQLLEHGHPAQILSKARNLLSILKQGDMLCHGDFNPNNVLMTSTGPRVIDWISAMVGDPLVDVGRIMMTMSVARIPETLHPGISIEAFWDLRRSFYTAYMEVYANLCGVSQDILTQELEPWLTMMATLALDEGSPEQQAWLESYVDGRLT